MDVTARILKGMVTSGYGFASKHDPEKLLDLIRSKSGLSKLLRGTLNVRLDLPYALRSDFRISRQEIKGQLGHSYGPGDYGFERCRIGNLNALILRPTESIHGSEILEIMAEVRLRQTLNIQDGDEVEVRVKE